MNKEKQVKLEGERFFGESKNGRNNFGFYSHKSSEDTALPGGFGVESMPFLRHSETEMSRWMQQNAQHKSKSEANIHDQLGFL